MKKIIPLLIILSFFVVLFQTVMATELKSASKTSFPKLTSEDWAWWRGPNRNGIAEAKQTPPLKWDAKTNVLWKINLIGRGHGSPTVVGDQIFLAIADLDEKFQAVVCYNRQTGKQQWLTKLHKGNMEVKGNKKATLASSTVACDGERLFINFLNNNAMTTSALDRSGKILWQQKITDYVVHQGFGSSPAIYGPLVIVSADTKGEGGGAIAAMNRTNGKFVWKKSRPQDPNYTSPIILKAANKVQLVFVGNNMVSSYEPLSGKLNWTMKGATTECVTSTVTDGTHIFTTGGYPKNHIAAVTADGSNKVVWEKPIRMYVPSMIAFGNHLYASSDRGVAMCLDSHTGKEKWKKRLGGTFSASVVKVGENIFATNESGTTFIFKANPNKFELVSKNKICDEIYATPTICNSRIYIRGANYDGKKRQETLYCVGK